MTRAVREAEWREEWGQMSDRLYDLLIELSELTLPPQLARDKAGAVAAWIQAHRDLK